MNHLMQVLRIDSFEKLLAAFRKAGVDLGNAIDGGAGWGGTSESILSYLKEESFVYAFEPFSGNHRFFSRCNSMIRLIKKALASEKTRKTLVVSSVVSSDSTWQNPEIWEVIRL